MSKLHYQIGSLLVSANVALGLFFSISRFFGSQPMQENELFVDIILLSHLLVHLLNVLLLLYFHSKELTNVRNMAALHVIVSIVFHFMHFQLITSEEYSPSYQLVIIASLATLIIYGIALTKTEQPTYKFLRYLGKCYTISGVGFLFVHFAQQYLYSDGLFNAVFFFNDINSLFITVAGLLIGFQFIREVRQLDQETGELENISKEVGLVIFTFILSAVLFFIIDQLPINS